MTDEQINIKIAELCGWKPQTLCTDYDGNPWPDSPPNYAADLNACHEFERTLLTADSFCGHWEEYSNRLVALLGCTDIFHATARQRCEAFLRVHNQWEKKA